MNVEQERAELAALRAEVVALFQLPDLTPEDRHQLKAMLIDLATWERRLNGFVRRVLEDIQRFERPDLRAYLNGRRLLELGEETP